MDGAAMHSIFWRDESGRNAVAGEAGLSNQEARKSVGNALVRESVSCLPILSSQLRKWRRQRSNPDRGAVIRCSQLRSKASDALALQFEFPDAIMPALLPTFPPAAAAGL